jgi:hypothetical protein
MISDIALTEEAPSLHAPIQRRGNSLMACGIAGGARVVQGLPAGPAAPHKRKSRLCYKEFPDGSAQVGELMPDGTYGDCQRYDLRPVPGPRCG